MLPRPLQSKNSRARRDCIITLSNRLLQPMRTLRLGTQRLKGDTYSLTLHPDLQPQCYTATPSRTEAMKWNKALSSCLISTFPCNGAFTKYFYVAFIPRVLFLSTHTPATSMFRVEFPLIPSSLHYSKWASSATIPWSCPTLIFTNAPLLVWVRYHPMLCGPFRSIS